MEHLKIPAHGISIHALLAESDAALEDAESEPQDISIHALLAESDHYDNYNLHCVEISIHALLAESDFRAFDCWQSTYAFLSTLSLRRATASFVFTMNLFRFLSTLSLRRATVKVLHLLGLLGFLSTLSLRRATAPRAGLTYGGGKFLSTLSLRRATWKKSPPMCFTKHFYPRSPCGERPHCPKRQ